MDLAKKPECITKRPLSNSVGAFDKERRRFIATKNANFPPFFIILQFINKKQYDICSY